MVVALGTGDKSRSRTGVNRGVTFLKALLVLEALLVFAHIVSEDEVAGFRETRPFLPFLADSLLECLPLVVLAFAVFVLDGSFLVSAQTVQGSRSVQAFLLFAHVLFERPVLETWFCCLDYFCVIVVFWVGVGVIP